MRKTLLLTAVIFLFAACHQGNQQTTDTASSIDYSQVATPQFNADSAYQYVADQLSFGYRTPGSVGQTKCAAYLVKQMQRWCDTVIVQDFPTTLWNGTQVRGKNIIASINARPGTTHDRRILLAAHWDSRLWADHDPDQNNHHSPILGANDGASGVGVLMELARIISTQRPSVSIDIIFFDVEDQGQPEWADSYEDNTWCLGSQYWSQHPHTPFYTASYGILLDMVGTEQPRYTKEQVSRQFASGALNKMWTVAAALGYDKIFENTETDPILDDHFYVNRMANIPMLDIVQNNRECSFFPHWHTLQDNLDHVDRNTLRITGQVILTTIYADYE